MNEIIFLSYFFFLAIVTLVAFRFWKVYLYVLLAITTLLMNIFVTKQYEMFWLLLTWGNALYWISFLITDLLSEYYWKKAALKGVAIWFLTTLMFVISTQVLLAYIPAETDIINESLKTIFWLAPRILMASLLAYLIAQTVDVYLFEKIRNATNWKYLGLRNTVATWVAQALDTVIFTFVGLTTIWSFEWVITMDLFWEVCIATYLIKLLVAILDTPFIYISRKIKPLDLTKPKT